MKPQSIRPRTIPLIALAGFMMLASLLAATPAAAAKFSPSTNIFCFYYGATPGKVIACEANVLGFGPDATGTLKLSASSYKGTLSTKVCSSLHCLFTYTPKGKGSPTRQDTITATYSGDANYTRERFSHKFPIVAPPQPILELSCQESVQTGTPASCHLSQDYFGPGFGFTTLSVPTYKGTLSLNRCPGAAFDCFFTYTPKGTGTARRVDTITASSVGDQDNSPTKTTTTIKVTATP